MQKYAFFLALLMFSTAASAEDASGDMTMGQHGNGSMDMPGITMDMQPILDDPLQAIPATLKTMFEREGKPLLVDPVVVQGDWAIAGWQQDGRGGRALLEKGSQGWRLNLLSGNDIKDTASLEKAGLSNGDAAQLSVSLGAEEKRMDAKSIALFGTFEGSIVIAASEVDARNGGHEGHAK